MVVVLTAFIDEYVAHDMGIRAGARIVDAKRAVTLQISLWITRGYFRQFRRQAGS